MVNRWRRGRFHRLTLRSATAFSQRENHGFSHQPDGTRLFENRVVESGRDLRENLIWQNRFVVVKIFSSAGANDPIVECSEMV